jgi:Ca2+-binding RTX toxin-like protein
MLFAQSARRVHQWFNVHRRPQPIRGGKPRLEVEALEGRLLLACNLNVPALSSLPGATSSLYLDFDGDTEASVPGAGTNITVPAFDMDGNPSCFSATELSTINEVWQRVSEDYAPFNLNVTTVYPGNFSNKQNLHVDIGGSYKDQAWLTGPPSSGMTTLSFAGAGPNVVFVFSKDIVNWVNTAYVGAAVATTCSHEAGHAFGLSHQRTFDANGALGSEYNPGTFDWTPIMGNNLSAARTTWWNGTTTDQYTTEDELAILSSPLNGFGYRLDDHGNTPATATPLQQTGPQVSGSGIIEQMSDVDYFSFQTGGGLATLNVNVAAVGANLDARAELYGPSGLIAVSDSDTSLNATISTYLAEGTYYLAVRSHGRYGDLGQYTITGTVPKYIYLDQSTGTIRIDGTPVDDTAIVSIDNRGTATTLDDQVVVTLTGGWTQTNRYNLYNADGTPHVTYINFLGHEGNDSFTNNTWINCSAGGGPGNDTLTGGSGDDHLFGNDGNDVINGGAGNDWLVGDSYDIVDNVFYGTGNDTINVENTVPGTTPWVNAGAGDDTINLSPVAQNLDNFGTGLSINGGGGNDTLNVDDQNSTTPAQYILDTGSLTRWYYSWPYFTYSNVRNVVVNCTNTANGIAVWSVAAGTTVTVHAGGGDDTFNLGSFSQNLDKIQGTLVLDGGSGNNSVTVNDQGNPFSDTYTITDTSLTRYVNGFTYSAIQSLALNAGSGSSPINVSPAGNFLDHMTAHLSIDGGPGSDTLTVNDQGDIYSDSYTITGQTLARTYWTGLNYTNVEALTLNAGSGSNVLNVQGTAAGVATALNSGSGNDTIKLSALPAGPLTIDGQGGTNTLDYSAFTTGVVVNLVTGSATGLSSMANIVNVTGGAGNDILVGNAQANVLNGGGGRNLLIGGAGADQLIGGSGDDLLIGGSTTYDTNAAALAGILAEWGRTDVDYATRIGHLKGTQVGGWNGATLLTSSNMYEDWVADTLTGALGQDWFWTGYWDVTDLASGEHVD